MCTYIFPGGLTSRVLLNDLNEIFTGVLNNAHCHLNTPSEGTSEENRMYAKIICPGPDITSLLLTLSDGRLAQEACDNMI